MNSYACQLKKNWYHYPKGKGPVKTRKGTMSQKRATILLSFFILLSAKPMVTGAKILVQSTIKFKEIPYNEGTKRKIEKGLVYVKSEVESFEENKIKKQKLIFSMAGLHPKSCRFALRKLSQYESYKDYLDFVDDSTYDDERKIINLSLESILLPFKMVLNFYFPRLKGPGVYNFRFERGFLKDLRGQFHISDYKKRCSFFMKASWIGPDSKIPDVVFEFFTSTLAKLGMEKLFKVSSILSSKK